MDDGYVNVRVVLRERGLDTRSWEVDVDADVPVAELRLDLVRQLGLGGQGGYELRREGSLAVPVLVLRPSAEG